MNISNMGKNIEIADQWESDGTLAVEVDGYDGIYYHELTREQVTALRDHLTGLLEAEK